MYIASDPAKFYTVCALVLLALALTTRVFWKVTRRRRYHCAPYLRVTIVNDLDQQ